MNLDLKTKFVPMKSLYVGLIICSLLTACTNTSKFDVDKQINYCVYKATKTLNNMPDTYSQLPRNIKNGSNNWNYVGIKDWTSGFWPGILWYIYEYTDDNNIKAKADSFTMALQPLIYQKPENHDLGFMIYNSFGNGYRLTQNGKYKENVLKASDLLATLYNSKVGTILSWPEMVTKKGWPHNTIIDNMMNLEMLFWAAENGENKSLFQLADTHAETTLKNHFRSDFSTYHVVVYDTISGLKIKGVTHQGFSDSSMWARGQAWSIYGFTLCYRETKKMEYLDLAKKAAKLYLKRLPDDYIPFWDFDAPDIPNAPKDASAAAITASALLEIYQIIDNNEDSKEYFDAAEKMLVTLSSPKYLSGNKNQAFLMHSTGHKPNNSEVDASIIYADYYYLEALLRMKKIQEGKSIYENF
jgi:unsaturated chondroitin disaccharide hydrolase